MRILLAADRVATPWKNGGGSTVEIATFPAGAGFDAFGWRISLATVAADGPFSVFPGIDRTLTLVDGDGLDLTVDGVAHRLVPGAPPLSFPGDVPAAGRLLGGPIRDLNVMTRRGIFFHRVERADAGPVTAADDAATLVTALADARIGATRLTAGDTIVLDAGETIPVTGAAVTIRIARC